MSRKFVDWMRVVLPPSSTVGAVFLIYLLLEGIFAWVSWRWGRAAGVLGVRDVFLSANCFAYGVYRVTAFHPINQPDYRRWLEQTPWTWRKPLPLGPIHLVPQDVLVVGLLTVMRHDPQSNLLHGPLLFLFGYLLALCWSAAAIKLWWAGYGIAFGLGLMVLWGRDPMQSLGAGVATYALGLVSIQVALRRFPWELSRYAQCKNLQEMIELSKQQKLGWPFDRLQPKRPELWVSYRDGVLISALVAWWTYVLLTVLPHPPGGSPFVVFPFFGLTFCVIARLGVYLAGYRSPMNFWGRLFTLRWIMPRYDVIFLAPLLMVFFTAATPLLLWGQWQQPPQIVAAAAVFIVLTVGLNLGPPLERWRMTGHHRIVPDLNAAGTFSNTNAKQEFVEL